MECKVRQEFLKYIAESGANTLLLPAPCENSLAGKKTHLLIEKIQFLFCYVKCPKTPLQLQTSKSLLGIIRTHT